MDSSKKCFSSEQSRPFRPKLQFYYDKGVIKAEFIPSLSHSGYKGLIHGGIISYLLDEVMGIAAGYEQDKDCFAAELNIRFLAPLPIDKKVTILGLRVADKKKLWLTHGEIKDEEGLIYARAQGKYLPLSVYKKSKIEKRLNISLVSPVQFRETKPLD